MKNLRLRFQKGRFFLNTSKSDEFIVKQIREIQGLVDVTDESSITIVNVIATMVGVHSVIRSYICSNCNRKTKESEIEGFQHCDKCCLNLLKSKCPVTWFASILISDISNNERTRVNLRNSQVHQMKQLFNFTLDDEDDVAKSLLEVTQPFKITMDITDRVVTNIEIVD